MQLISDAHRKRYKDYYKTAAIEPRINRWHTTVQILMHVLDAETLLDYGCGAVRSLEIYLPQFAVQSYDPGIPALSALPERADLVICLDVLEHCEDETSVKEVLHHIRSLSKKGIFLTISCAESESKMLPDGTPWHSFVRPLSYWRGLLFDFAEIDGGDSRNQYIGMKC